MRTHQVLEAMAAGCPVVAWAADHANDPLNGGAIPEVCVLHAV